MRRVVVTGLGLVTPLACGVEQTWTRLLKGESGVKAVSRYNVSDISSKIAGQVPSFEEQDDGFNPDDYMSKKEQKRVDSFYTLWNSCC